MKIIDNKHIDIKKYKQLLADFGCTEAAMQPWILDVVSPGWGMLCDKTGNYLMPLPIRYKFLLPYTTMPIFGQRFEVLSTSKENLIPRIVKYLRRDFVRGNISFNVSGLQGRKFRIRQTFQLPLESSYDVLWNAMSEGHQRNISKAEELNRIKLSPENWNALVTMKKNLLDEREVKFTEVDYQSYFRLVQAAVEQHNSPFLVAMHDEIIVAAALFVKIGNRYVIESATTPEGRKSMAAYSLINHFIKEYAGTSSLLDFAGSNIQSIAAFRKGFGAIRSEYTNVQWRWI